MRDGIGRHWGIVCAVGFAAAAALPAAAGEREDLEALRATTLGIVQALVDQGWITKEKADELMKLAAKKPPPAGVTEETVKEGGDEKVVRVPYVPQVVRDEIYEKVKQDVGAQAKTERWGDPGALPDWVGRLKLSGDLRMRLEDDKFASDNAPYQAFQSIGQLLNNTTVGRDVLRLRGRLAVDADLSESWKGGVRVATCRANDPLCIDAQAGTDGSRSEIRLDRLFLSYSNTQYATKVAVGRFDNPFLSTDLVWNTQLGFDGVAAKYEHAWNDNMTQFLSGGVFPLQDIDRSSTVLAKRKWLYGAQTGANLKLTEQHSVKLGIAYYDFHNLASQLNPVQQNSFTASAPTFRQRGNTVFNIDSQNTTLTSATDFTQLPWGIASKFRVLNLTAIGDVATYDPIHLTLSADYAKNLGFDQADIYNRTGLWIPARTKAWHVRAQVGHPRIENQGDWQAFVAYKYVEPDAVVDAFNDSDFHGGGTDAKGYILGGSYGLDKNVWVTLRYMSAQSVSSFSERPQLGLDSLFLDLNARF